MSLGDRTLAFATQAMELQTRKALGASLLGLVEPLGATTYACLYLRREKGTVVIDRSLSNVSRQWLELYLERGYDAADPVFQGVMRGGAYGYWDEMTRGMVLNRTSREVMGAASDHAMRQGFTKRVTLDAGGIAVMMVAGLELDKDRNTKAALRMAFDVFANEGARMLKVAPGGGGEAAGENEPSRDLSKTQLKVLLMRSEGMSNKQVAQTLGRHEKTVECHVTEILRRLEARNMIDAIRIATRMKLIL
jgi:DNA-binding NarL/FixJ family response regulator